LLQEHPVATALDFDLEGKGTHCSYCLRVIEKAIKPPTDRLSCAYCSPECHTLAKSQSQDFLFTTTPPLPQSATPPDLPADLPRLRAAAQDAFVKRLQGTRKAFPLLTARLVARQIMAEVSKMVPGAAAPTIPSAGEVPEADTPGFTINDHVERLRYLELSVPAEETQVVRDVLRNALPGLESFLTDERHAVLLGKIGYNAYGVYFGTGRDDKV
jgi:import receptor subunit TOM20